MIDIIVAGDLSQEFSAPRREPLLDNGLQDIATSLIEAYGSGNGRPWRIKFAYETVAPLSMERLHECVLRSDRVTVFYSLNSIICRAASRSRSA